MSIKSSTRIV